AVEDLSVRNMMANPQLATSIADAAWTQCAAHIACKAVGTSRQSVAASPAYTSQACSGCGHRNAELTLAGRTYSCPCCGLAIDRDRNAARNILGRGRQSIKALG